MRFPKFGPFSAAFDSDGLSVPGYLTLLNLRHEDTQIVIERIEQAIRAKDSQRWIDALLMTNNWRPHLVAAVAFLLAHKKQMGCTTLWTAIDAGSWVTPQLVVAAFFIDAEFAEKAANRMEQHCPVSIPQGYDDLQGHVVTGPGSVQRRSGKMFASLLSVCTQVPTLASREQSWRENEDNQPLLAEDAAWDNSDRITASWLAAVQAQLLRRGIILESKFR